MAQSVQRLKMYGLEVKFAATISSLNISKMEDVATTALSLGVRDLEFGVAIPAGRGRQLPPLTLTNYKFIYENTRSLAEIYKKYGLNIRFYQEELNFQCRLVKDLIFIDSSGEVFPCVGIRTSLGNIKVTGLEEIMNREKFKLVAQLPAPTAAVCGGCRLLEFCEGCHVQGLLNGAGAENCTYCRLARKAGLTDV
jgi:radical SAM protein with 4Fe4S-binding SPASM domain